MAFAFNAIAASTLPTLPDELLLAIRSAMQAHPDVMIANSQVLSAKSQVEAGGYSMADNSRTLAGAGLGVNASLHSWQFDSYVAWPTQGGTPLSEPASAERIPRLWVQMSGDF